MMVDPQRFEAALIGQPKKVRRRKLLRCLGFLSAARSNTRLAPLLLARLRDQHIRPRRHFPRRKSRPPHARRNRRRTRHRLSTRPRACRRKRHRSARRAPHLLPKRRNESSGSPQPRHRLSFRHSPRRTRQRFRVHSSLPLSRPRHRKRRQRRSLRRCPRKLVSAFRRRRRFRQLRPDDPLAEETQARRHRHQARRIRRRRLPRRSLAERKTRLRRRLQSRRVRFHFARIRRAFRRRLRQSPTRTLDRRPTRKPGRAGSAHPHAALARRPRRHKRDGCQPASAAADRRVERPRTRNRTIDPLLRKSQRPISISKIERVADSRHIRPGLAGPSLSLHLFVSARRSATPRWPLQSPARNIFPSSSRFTKSRINGGATSSAGIPIAISGSTKRWPITSRCFSPTRKNTPITRSACGSRAIATISSQKIPTPIRPSPTSARSNSATASIPRNRLSASIK